MGKKYRVALLVLLAAGVVAVAILVLKDSSVPVLNPKGLIAHQQKRLIIFTLLLSLLVVIPVYVLAFMIAWKYRASNTKAKYRPNWDHHPVIEAIWWLIPSAIILVLGVVTWKSSHSLDPYRPISSNVKPITIQVVALQWKWLFIYPEQNIASVNFVEFPEGTPVNFEITADAPMNSFWIPSLGGQIYAMPGMTTKLHLMADKADSYYGSSANLSGKGFAGMKFIAQSSTQTEFDQWVESVRLSDRALTSGVYNKLAKPSENTAPITYATAQKDLFNDTLTKYMSPPDSLTHTHPNESMQTMGAR